MGEHISWPDERERRKLAGQTGRQSAFPDCVGFIDGTVFPLEYKSGLPDAVDFWNYKGFYALSALAVCDVNRVFRYVLLGFPGSAHVGEY
jgi:hypothetical protein